eukprot:CAMPEP_0113967958 /NCGR_PEP_ID=MMETSP0011_2-20120614/9236_1 /TAXON_ID=101924 /ORGANISM="Rhodosorus marinus" /LENGTH=506 /DNA_ID=CAMNT_0000980933 /DNA_START=95 /DNA_END=1615 /DNA_ORIENTATION=- /assembly_acc=CAM_ASM_000156
MEAVAPPPPPPMPLKDISSVSKDLPSVPPVAEMSAEETLTAETPAAEAPAADTEAAEAPAADTEAAEAPAADTEAAEAPAADTEAAEAPAADSEAAEAPAAGTEAAEAPAAETEATGILAAETEATGILAAETEATGLPVAETASRETPTADTGGTEASLKSVKAGIVEEMGRLEAVVNPLVGESILNPSDEIVVAVEEKPVPDDSIGGTDVINTASVGEKEKLLGTTLNEEPVSASTADKVDTKEVSLIEDLSKTISFMADPMTIFFAELVVILFINAAYSPILQTWFCRIVIPPVLISSVALGFFWRRESISPNRILEALSEQEQKRVTEFEKRLKERTSALDAKEKALFDEEEKLRAVRDQLKDGLLQQASAGQPEDVQPHRGVELGPSAALEAAGEPARKTVEEFLPPRTLAGAQIKLDANMIQICQHAFETFEERERVLQARANLGLDSNTAELSRTELQKKSKEQSVGILASFLQRIRPYSKVPAMTKPNKKLLTSRRID